MENSSKYTLAGARILQLSYDFGSGVETPYGVKIQVPGTGMTGLQIMDGTVQIENQHVTITTLKHGAGTYYFDEKYQHLRSQSQCDDRIIKISEKETYRKNSTPDVWNEIRRDLESPDQAIVREALFQITHIHGLKHRPMLPLVLTLTKSPNTEIRAFAVAAGAHQVAPLIDYLKRLKELKNDPEPWVRSEVERAIVYNSYLIKELEDDFSQDIRKLVKDLLSTK